jgi:hypothetical protein
MSDRLALAHAIEDVGSNGSTPRRSYSDALMAVVAGLLFAALHYWPPH